MDGLSKFLDQIELERNLEIENDSENQSKDAVTLITLHNTKGLEFSRVVITGMEHEIFPRADKTGEDLEEERRLFYVGITRAKKQLFMTNSKVRVRYGQLCALPVSPFLAEINPENLEILGQQPPSYRKYFSSNRDDDEIDNPFAVKWKKGKAVYHDDYGTGQIVSTKIVDDEFMIQVDFGNGELKKFYPKYQQNRLTLVIE
jgi:DNA helicase-2/ATP-dependent DNA helicase PcrA